MENGEYDGELQLRATCPSSPCTFNIDQIGIWLNKHSIIQYSMQLIINGLFHDTWTKYIVDIEYWIMPLTWRDVRANTVDAYYFIFLDAVAKSPIHRCCSTQRRWCVKEVARLSADSALGKAISIIVPYTLDDRRGVYKMIVFHSAKKPPWSWNYNLIREHWFKNILEDSAAASSIKSVNKLRAGQSVWHFE